VNSGLTPLFFSLFSSFFYSQASKATTHATTTAVPKNEPTMDSPSRSPVPSTVTCTNAFKEENRGGGGPCETIKMARKEENVSGIVLTNEDDDTRRLKLRTNENDATTKVQNDATVKRYEHIGEGAVLRTTLTWLLFLFSS
jgi:hypothetical protein